MRRCLVDQLSVGVVCCRLGCGCGSWTNWLVQQFTCCGRQVDTVYFHKHDRTCQLLFLSYKTCVHKLFLLIHTDTNSRIIFLVHYHAILKWIGAFLGCRIRIFIPTFQFMTTYDLGSVVGTHTSIKPSVCVSLQDASGLGWNPGLVMPWMWIFKNYKKNRIVQQRWSGSFNYKCQSSKIKMAMFYYIAMYNYYFIL